MKQKHVHSWRLTSPHALVAVLKYSCTSCAETRQERRPTAAEEMARMEAVLDRYESGWMR